MFIPESLESVSEHGVCSLPRSVIRHVEAMNVSPKSAFAVQPQLTTNPIS
jgi:hypothetical protein